MRKVLFLLLITLILTGCRGNEAVEETVKQKEMSQDAALEYLEQMTYRLVEAWENEDGSFEQKSSLNAAIGRNESVMEEIYEKYEEVPEIILDVKANVSVGAKNGLEGGYSFIEICLTTIAELIEEEYGELPPTLSEIM